MSTSSISVVSSGNDFASAYVGEADARVGEHGSPRRAGRILRPAPAILVPGEVTAGDHPIEDVLRRERVYRRMLACADVLAVLLSAVIASVVAHTQLPAATIAVVAAAIPIAKAQRLYDRDELVINKSTAGELPRLLQLSAVLAILLDLVRENLGDGRFYGLGFSIAFCAVATASLLCMRAGARRFALLRTPPDRCLIIGDASRCDALSAQLNELPGVQLLGAVAMSDFAASHRVARELVEGLRVHRLIIAPDSHLPDDELFDAVRGAKATGVRVTIFPRAMAAIGSSVVFDELGGLTLLGVPHFGLSRSSNVLKRWFDVVFAAAALICLAPLFLLCAILIKADGSGRVLFRQTRVGRNGRAFTILKFRSMVTDAEALKQDLLLHNEAGHGLFKLADDPRVTRVGRWLRRTRIDELPQLINVLRGEMSLVGPRPLVLEEDERVLGLDRCRLDLTPGITGPWQILGPMRVPLAEMAKLDYLYISNWSLWQDIAILLKTAALVFARNGV